jgi:uncharacterized protein (TIGR03000 family)
MYSVVLATMMTLAPNAPDTFLFHGCHGCYGCYGCHGCYGCYGCYGCCGYSTGWGCYGCYGCSGCYGYTCHGCYGSCWGSFGYAWYSYYPSCYGCCGGVIVAPPPKVIVPEKPKLPKPAEDKSEVTITAPADVRLTVDGQPLALQGTTRTFETPSLEMGRTYSYVFRAEAMRDGKVVGRVQKVILRAGEAKQVDFSDLSVKAVAHVTIVTPLDAKVIVNGVSYPEGMSQRTLETPELEAGRRYAYTMRAEVVREGRVHRQERRVEVEAGKDVTVEFKDLPVVQAAQR